MGWVSQLALLYSQEPPLSKRQYPTLQLDVHSVRLTPQLYLS